MVDVHIAVMDYQSNQIRLFTTQMNAEWTDDDVEKWLGQHDDLFYESTCYYMCSARQIEVEYGN